MSYALGLAGVLGLLRLAWWLYQRKGCRFGVIDSGAMVAAVRPHITLRPQTPDVWIDIDVTDLGGPTVNGIPVRRAARCWTI